MWIEFFIRHSPSERLILKKQIPIIFQKGWGVVIKGYEYFCYFLLEGLEGGFEQWLMNIQIILLRGRVQTFQPKSNQILWHDVYSCKSWLQTEVVIALCRSYNNVHITAPNFIFLTWLKSVSCISHPPLGLDWLW